MVSHMECPTMGLTPRIWSHLAGVWQQVRTSRSVLRPPQMWESYFNNYAVPDRARAARAGGEYSKNLHRRAPPAPPRPAAPPPRPAAPRLSQKSGFARSRSLVSFLNCARSADRRVGLPGSGLGIESSGSNAPQSGYQIWGIASNEEKQNGAMHRPAQPEHLSWTRRRATTCASSI